MIELALGLIGALSMLAACTASGAIYFLIKRPPPRTSDEVMTQVNALRLSVADLTDRVEQWQKRDRVRNLRAGREAEQAESPPVDKANLKNFLRRQAFGSNQ